MSLEIKGSFSLSGIGKKAAQISVPLHLDIPSSPSSAPLGVILAHGASGDLSSPHIRAYSSGLAARGIHCLTFTHRSSSIEARTHVYKEVLEHATSWEHTRHIKSWVLAGHSMGSRAAAASLVHATEGSGATRQPTAGAIGRTAALSASTSTGQARKRKRGGPDETDGSRGSGAAPEAPSALVATQASSGAAGAPTSPDPGSGSGSGSGAGAGAGAGAELAALLARHAVAVCGCLLFSFPFHPPGKPDQLRDDAICGIRLPVMVVRGSRDPFATDGPVQDVLGRMQSEQLQVHVVTGGGHLLELSGQGKEARQAEELARVLDASAAFCREISRALKA